MENGRLELGSANANPTGSPNKLGNSVIPAG